MDTELKRCKCCLHEKPITDFYLYRGWVRGDCKKCTIKKNTEYQRENEVWKYRHTDTEKQREWKNSYYQNNKEKFAEYRKRFKEKNPEYYKLYARKRKDEMREKSQG